MRHMMLTATNMMIPVTDVMITITIMMITTTSLMTHRYMYDDAPLNNDDIPLHI